MSAKKIILITSVLLIGSIGIAYAFRKRKDITSTKRSTVSAGSPSSTTEDGSDILKTGSLDVQHVMQLQEVLNIIHKASKYINTYCSGIKWGYAPGTLPDGNIVKEDGIFDSNTAAASRLYLNREEVELDYLTLIKNKIAKWKLLGDKCVYPLGVTV